ncbi:ABC transporter permease [Methylobacterium aerolatum]|uniref:Simple sugar transport system permease protein n=1 Tax=Methylobacterium aerolatum TaxID=418708 RepID=A0ABU0HXC8_9HYPH|nr:ABC transporter permease [Methylobacterium aerolatum]MDQ0446126.1 simple sugar transport system permease protein [Methylobacterium aerolatum]GJD35162.1 putative riboflavin import permease protein RfuC [Methylobacterium aerolatum]
MRLDLVPRPHRSPLAEALAPALAFLAAVLVGGVAVSLLGVSPAAAFVVYFVAPLSELWSLQEVAVKAAPLALIATGLAFCYRANLWNIGAEGQFVVGGLAGGMVAIATHGSTGFTLWILPAMLAAGTLAGIAYAMIPALLRVRLGVSEILTSLMLVYVAELLLDYMARGPLRDPAGYNFPQSVAFDEAARLPALMEGDALHAGVLVALAAVGLGAVVLGRSLFGFEMRLVGASPRAARFAGFSAERLTLLAFAISGGAAGLAGIVEVAGRIGQLQPSISPGYGFTAIIVAFLGRLSPVGILVAAFVIAVTTIGGEAAQIDLRLPLDLTRAFQGLLLGLVLGADVLTRFRLRLVAGTAR